MRGEIKLSTLRNVLNLPTDIKLVLMVKRFMVQIFLSHMFQKVSKKEK